MHLDRDSPNPKTKMAQQAALATKQHFTTYKFYPWVLISLCASLLFYKYILNVSPSIMAHELMKQFQINGTGLGSLAATFFYTCTIIQIFGGVLVDKYGSRFLTGGSIFIGASGALLFSMADTLQMATLARAMMGVGVSFATVTYLKMTAVWFRPEQKAFVGGLLATAVMLGAVFGAAPLAMLLDRTSWRFVLEFCAILGFVIFVLFVLFVRDKSPQTAQNSNPHMEAEILPQETLSWDEFKKVFRNKQNWLLTGYSGLAFAPLTAFGGLWGPAFLQEAYHISRTQSSGLVSLIFVGLGVGSPLWGLLSDRLGKRIGVMKWGLVLSLLAIGIVCYLPGLSVWALGLFMFLFGFGVGAFMLGFTLGTQINNLALAATVISLINTGDSVLESFTEPLIGKLLDLSWDGMIVDGIHHFSTHNYRFAFVPLPAYLVLAFVLLCFVKEDAKS